MAKCRSGFRGLDLSLRTTEQIYSPVLGFLQGLAQQTRKDVIQGGHLPHTRPTLV